MHEIDTVSKRGAKTTTADFRLKLQVIKEVLHHRVASCGEKEKRTLPMLLGKQHDVRAGLGGKCDDP